MRHFPNEIWSIIFQAALEPSPYGFPVLDPSYPALILTRVCRQWCSIIMSNPAFWCRFTFMDPTPNLAQINRFLARSGQMPLSVEITHNTRVKAPTQELLERSRRILTTILQRRKQRLKQLYITGPAPLELLELNIAQGLEALSIQSRGHMVSFGVEGIESLPMSRLTELRLELHADQLLTLNQCATILSNAPRLRICYMDAAYNGDSDVSAVSCPALQKIHILLRTKPNSAAGYRCNLVSFLDALENTCVDDLGIDWLVEDSVDGSHRNLGGLARSLSKWSQSMRSLRMSYLPLNDMEIGDCLSGLPNLDSVCLRYPLHGSNDPITHTLIRQLGYRSIHLECTGKQFDDEDLAELLDKVEICYLLTCRRRSEWLYGQQGSSQIGFVYP